MEISFKNKVALVTGAAMGMGLATAEAFAKAGATVVMADFNLEAVKIEAKKLEAYGSQILPIQCDVSKEDDVKAMIEQTIKNFGQLDAAFNNAGIMLPNIDTADVNMDDYDKLMNVNLRGVFMCTKYELQVMRQQERGTIVNNSSIGGLIGGAYRTAYIAAKHGVLGLTKSVALEYATRNIRINAVCPGTIDTPMVHKMYEKGDLVEDDIARLHPMGRLGKASEVANAVLWLSSPLSSYVTGDYIAVDGAYTVQ